MAVIAVLVVLGATKRWGKAMEGGVWEVGIFLLTILAFAGLATRAFLVPSPFSTFVAVIWGIVAVGACVALAARLGRFRSYFDPKGRKG